MGKFICLQSGHKNTQSNCDPTLATETGASGEMDFNWNVTLALSEILQRYGFVVQIDDANANCPGNPGNSIGKDFDFYLAIHAEGEPAGGAVAAPDPSVDASTNESNRIVNAIKSVYFNDTGIVDNPQIITNNMTFYYMWNVLTAATPCGIIECGALADPHDSVILSDIRRVALGIAHGICVAFNVAWQGDLSNQQNIQPNQNNTTGQPVVNPSTTATQVTSEPTTTIKPQQEAIQIPINTTIEHKTNFPTFIKFLEWLIEKLKSM